MKIKILLKEFDIWAFWGQNLAPALVKNGKKGYFNTSHLITNPVFLKNKVLHSSPNTKEKIFSVSLLKSVWPVLTNQTKRFISHVIGCSNFSRNSLLLFPLWHCFKILVKSTGSGTFLCLASSVNFQQKWFILI